MAPATPASPATVAAVAIGISRSAFAGPPRGPWRAAGSPSYPGNSTGSTSSGTPCRASPSARRPARPARGPRRTRTTHPARTDLESSQEATATPTGRRFLPALIGGNGSLPGCRQGTCRRCPRPSRLLLGAARTTCVVISTSAGAADAGRIATCLAILETGLYSGLYGDHTYHRGEGPDRGAGCSAGTPPPPLPHHHDRAAQP